MMATILSWNGLSRDNNYLSQHIPFMSHNKYPDRTIGTAGIFCLYAFSLMLLRR